MKLRDYQQAAIAAILSFWLNRSGINPALVLPTGAGKTIVFCSIIKQVIEEIDQNARFLVLAHRTELIDQAEKKLLSVWPGAPVGVYAAGLNRREFNQVTVASRGTIIGALKKYGCVFDYVVIDEAHNISPNDETEYQKILEELKRRNPDLKILGVTATPYRTGSGSIVGRDQVLNEIAYEVKLKFLMDNGYLCRVSAPAISHGVINTDQIPLAGGEFKRADHDKAFENNDKVFAAIKTWHKHHKASNFKLSVFFGSSVEHAKAISKALDEIGIQAPIITAKTPRAKRRAILEDAESLKYNAIVNVGVLTEGTDLPPIDCIVLMRATYSLGLYLQIIGRGLRLSPETNKTHCTLLDFGENIQRFGPIDIAKPPEKRNKDNRTQVCPNEECKKIIGFYARSCEHCGHVLMPKPSKQCPECDEFLSPSAGSCSACDYLFISHEEKLAYGRVLSDDAQPEKIFIDSVSLHVRSDCGASYISAFFHAAKSEKFAVKDLFIGYPGLAGEKALEEWRELMKPGTPEPSNAYEAARIFNSDNSIVREIESVLLDPTDERRQARAIFHKDQ